MKTMIFQHLEGGGSDTTAVAVAAAINADKCYIFSDVDRCIHRDPNKVKDAYKLQNISYKEMLDISNEGAKVLHNRSIEIGKNLIYQSLQKSTFNDEKGTVITKKLKKIQ